MAGIPKPGEVDSADIRRPNVQQLLVEHQKILDGVQKSVLWHASFAKEQGAYVDDQN